MKSIVLCITTILSLLIAGVSAANTSAKSSFDQGYRLSAGDKILVRVFDEPDMKVETLLDDSGEIDFTFAGIVKAKGLTTRELKQVLTQRLADGYLVNPEVLVSIVEYRPFYINGEVVKPGAYAYQPGLNLEKAIALAGGLTERASSRSLYLVKENDPKRAKKKIGLEVSISPGDIVIVEESFF